MASAEPLLQSISEFEDDNNSKPTFLFIIKAKYEREWHNIFQARVRCDRHVTLTRNEITVIIVKHQICQAQSLEIHHHVKGKDQLQRRKREASTAYSVLKLKQKIKYRCL